MTRPVITFATDFGPSAPAVCRGVMFQIAPDANVIDINHQIPRYSIREGAMTLVFALPHMPVGIHVAVVDPGVGTARRGIAIRVSRGDILIVPDNGLLVAALTVGSAAPHPHELALGAYSVHTSEKTLRAGESRIAETATPDERGSAAAGGAAAGTVVPALAWYFDRQQQTVVVTTRNSVRLEYKFIAQEPLKASERRRILPSVALQIARRLSQERRG